MIRELKAETGCKIFVTPNGRVWIDGPSEDHELLVIDAIRKIENEAHTSGLTDRVRAYIRNEKKKRGLTDVIDQ
jgi:exosome complex component RRP4